jgi:hypothetical protein
MNTHRIDLVGLSAAGLRSRRDRLVGGLPQAAAFLAGSRSAAACGKDGAGALVASGTGALAARTLVMVADPGYSAIRIYRSVGFADLGDPALAGARAAPSLRATARLAVASILDDAPSRWPGRVRTFPLLSGAGPADHFGHQPGS